MGHRQLVGGSSGLICSLLLFHGKENFHPTKTTNLSSRISAAN